MTTQNQPLNTEDDVRASVKQYYGDELSQSCDLKTSACATSAAPTARLAALIDNLHDETRARYFGCGLIAPEALSGAQTLDLGCGAGRDVYVLSQLVGESGRVVGVDMTAKQLEVAERRREWHREKFGHAVSNVAFLEGYLERLDELDLPKAGFDVVISNCVINLATDKPAVFAAVRRLLKPGGEFYFADIYADKPLSEAARRDPVLYGECLGGALVWSEFVRLAKEAGFAEPRIAAAAPIAPMSDDIAAAVGDVAFVSVTVRLFAADAARDAAPAALTYTGGADAVDAETDDCFAFDLQHRFEKDAPQVVSGATAALIQSSRFGQFFDVAAATGQSTSPAAEAIDPFTVAAASAAGPSGCCG
ncbi:MAG: methyltransferase domain-containing protein [Neomegalonema sp.]|nr:methyltransferase domain-containing protein [Neomegalonema sp.]